MGRERRSFHFLERKARLPTAKLVAGLKVPWGQERALCWCLVGRDEAHHLSAPDCSSSVPPVTHRFETEARLPFFSSSKLGSPLWPSHLSCVCERESPERGRQEKIRALPKGGVAKGTSKNFSSGARDMAHQ